MDNRSHCFSSVKFFPPSFDMPKPFKIDLVIMKAIYEERFKGNPSDDPIAHLIFFKRDVIALK
jgi:hypothetical protein